MPTGGAPLERADLLVQALDRVPDGVMIWSFGEVDDPSSLVLELVNEAGRDVLGLPPQMLGRTFEELFPSLAAGGLAEVARGTLLSGRSIDLGTLEFGDERVRRSTFHARVHPLDDRRILAVFELLEPVVAHPSAPEPRTEAPDEGLIRCSLDGTVQEWQQSAVQIYGVPVEQAVGRPFAEVVRAERPEEIADAFRLVRAGSHSYHLRSQQTGCRGQLDVAMTVTPIWGRSKERTGASVVVRDMTAVVRARETLDFVLEAAALGHWDLDLSTDRVHRSLTHDQLFGYDEPQPDWTHATFLAHVHPDDRARVTAWVERVLSGVDERENEFRVVWPDGTVRWLASRGRLFRDPDGTPARVAGVIWDITKRKRAELQAIEAANRFSGLVQSMGDAVVGSTMDGVVTSWNPGAERLFGWTEQEMLGRQLSLITPADRLEESQELRDAIARGETLHDVDTVRRCKDGTLMEFALTASPLRGSDGSVIGITAVVRDVSERRRLEADLRHQALHDPLTGLSNRALIRDRLEHALTAAGRSGRPVAVLLLDLDNFKIINDAAGHSAGDRLLVETANRLQGALRPEDSIARFGGDEFVAICEHTDKVDALGVAERLHAALMPPIEIEGRPIVVTASIGIALSPPMDADVLLRSADTAMYHAKASGRARSSIFGPPMAARAKARLELSLQLREAIASNGLELHYQPVVDLRTGELLGVEALARWDHPTRGAIPAPEFVEIAEETGLITALDRWAVQRACRDGAAMVASGVMGRSGHVAVNIGARNISSDLISDTVVDAVAAAGADFGYSQLTLEVTETAVMADLDKAQQTLQGLSALGASIALDDFGTGYSSLTYLQRLPISVLKIDQSFVQRLTLNPQNKAIARSIVHLASAIGISTVAEGIETTGQLALLQDMNCTAGQGWLWAGARSLPDLTALVLALPEQRFPVS